MKESRTKNSIYNICASLIEYFIGIVSTFVIRSVFIKILGTEYLGLDGLFTNVISIMNITELGLGSAIIFGLYKPLLNKDEKKINILMHIYKKCYLFIGLLVFVIGLILIPFLPNIINSNYDFGNIYMLFFLYIFQALSTYWILAYKEAILIADQKKYKMIKITNIIQILRFGLKLMALWVFKSFVIYLVVQILTAIIRNILIAIIVNRNYPYIKKYNGQKLEKTEKKALIQNIVGMSMYKISSTVMSSTDNIIISIFINLTSTGSYSNYLLLISNIKTVLNTIFNSITSSVGNLYAEGNKKKSEFVFRCINFLNFWIFGFVAICLWELLNPFITIWIGKVYIFDKLIVLLIVLNFITDGLQQAVIMYKDACGLFWKGKLRPVFSAISNLVISIILVKPLGIVGVILGSIISRMITTWWFDPYLVYTNAFNMSPKKYYFKYLKSLLIIIISASIIDVIMFFICLGFIYTFIIKILLCIVIPNTIFYITFRKQEELSYFKEIIISYFKRFKKCVKF